MTLHQLFVQTATALREHPCDGTHPAREAEELLVWAAGVTREGMVSHGEEAASPSAARRVRAAVARRLRHEPMEYITGSAPFFGRAFRVTRATLIPRPATETVMGAALEEARGIGARRVLDIGTGSGAIAITAALELAGAQVLGTDVSAAALRIARANARALGAGRVRFLRADLLSPPATAFMTGAPTVLVANLPYVPSANRRTMPREVTAHEPASALFSGKDGLRHITRLLRQVARAERTAPLTVVLEMLPEQCAVVTALARDLFEKPIVRSIPQEHGRPAGLVIRLP